MTTITLKHPHDQLLITGKKTAILTPDDLPVGEPVQVEGVGVIVLGDPARMLASEADRKEYADTHRVRQQEREAWWPGEQRFQVYPVVRMRLDIEDWRAGDEKEGDNEMPYEIEERDGQHCVVKEDSGDVEKCHESKDDAEAHLAALQINVEAEEKAAAVDGYTIVQSDDRWCIRDEEDGEFLECFDTEAEAEAVMIRLAEPVEDKQLEVMAQEVEKLRAKIEQMEKARGEGQGVGGEPQEDGGTDVCVCPECGAEYEHERGVPCAETPCPECDKPMAGKSEEPPEPELEEKAGRRIKKPMLRRLKDALETLKEIVHWGGYEDEEQSSLGAIFKMHESGFAIKADTNQILLWTTNAFIDRDEEIFSTKGLERYVAEAEKRDERGSVNLWHVKGTEFADVVAQGVMGRFLVELAEFHPDARGQAMKAFFKKYPDGHPEHAPEGWGCSPEFRYLPEERKQRVFENFWITDRAVLPRWAAANIQTRATGGSTMTLITEKQAELFKEALGEEEFNNLVQAAEKESEELEASGVAHKALDASKVAGRLRAMAKKADDDMAKALEDLAAEMEGDEDDEDEKAVEPAPEIDLNALAAEIAQQLDVDVEPLVREIDGLKAKIEALEVEKAKKERVEALDKPRFVLSLEKRASQAVETELDPENEADKALLEAGPKTTEPPAGSGANHFFSKK